MQKSISHKQLIYLSLFLITPIFLWSFFRQLKTTQTNAANQPTKPTTLQFALPTPALLPAKIKDTPIQLSVKAAYVLDVNSMSALYDQNANVPVSLASTTKIMTALVALENYSLDDLLTVDGVITDGSNVGLLSGEKYRVSDLLGALLVGSANDAAEVLASNFPGGSDNFIWAMNQKAIELKMNNTHFTNPIGYDNLGHYSSARDLAILTTKAIHQPLFASLVAQKDYSFSDETNQKQLRVESTNELLGTDNSILGVKTGWTEEAGECLVAFVKRNDTPLITVVLGSGSRFEDTEKLINWAYQTYQWKPVI